MSGTKIKKFPECEECKLFLATRTKTERALICETARACGKCEKDMWRVEAKRVFKERRKRGIKTSLGFYYQTDPYLEFLEALSTKGDAIASLSLGGDEKHERN